MDNRTGAINPLSDQFQQFAVRNVSQQMGTLRTNKELKTDDGDEARQGPEDKVELSSGGKASEQDSLLAAQHAGVLSEEADRVKKQSGSRENAARVGVRAETPEGASTSESKGKAPAAEPEAIIRDAARMPKPLSLDEIRGDTPPEMFEAARTIVKGQIHPVTGPSTSLTEMKSVSETAGVAANTMQAFHPLMDIHDTNNLPIAVLE